MIEDLRAMGFASAAITDAEAYLTDLINARANSGTFPFYSDTWLSPDDHNTQGLIYNASTPVPSPISAVPEPATVFSGLLLLLPFAAKAVKALRRSPVV
ncbi:MAG: hypothetical protein ACREIC_27130, partial [Limisphaerales bacterium]